VGVALFDYRLPADPTPFLLGTAFYIIAAVFYGMAVGNVMGTQSAAIQAVQLGAFLVSMLLSGFLVPVSNMPVELRWIASIIPATYYVHVTRDAFLRSGGWESMGGSVAVLALMCLFFFGANLKRMHRMQFAD
jgi:ABC-2 type transport system permease protein